MDGSASCVTQRWNSLASGFRERIMSLYKPGSLMMVLFGFPGIPSLIVTVFFSYWSGSEAVVLFGLPGELK